MKRLHRISVLLCAVLLSCCLTACASGNDSLERTPDAGAAGSASSSAMSPELGGETEPAASADGTNGIPFPTRPDTGHKIIQNLYYRIETKEFVKSMEALNTLVTETGGYMESNQITGTEVERREGQFTLRIPQEKLSAFQQKADSVGVITNMTTSSDDVTEQYFDTEARLKALRTKESRLLALLEKTEKLGDIVELENALAETNAEIEALTSQLRRLDSEVNYSTVEIQLYEVAEPAAATRPPTTLGEKISYQFQESMKVLGNFGEGLLILIVGGLPILLPIALFVGLVLLLVRFFTKLGQKNRETRVAAYQSRYPAPPPPVNPTAGQAARPYTPNPNPNGTTTPPTPPTPPTQPEHNKPDQTKE